MQLLYLHQEGILHVGVTPEQLEILSGTDDLTTYQFNTGAAKHTFCRHCGMHPFYVPRSDPENYSVNARCLDDYDPVEMRPRRFFDGRNWEAAFAQREAAEGDNTQAKSGGPVDRWTKIMKQVNG